MRALRETVNAMCGLEKERPRPSKSGAYLFGVRHKLGRLHTVTTYWPPSCEIGLIQENKWRETYTQITGDSHVVGPPMQLVDMLFATIHVATDEKPPEFRQKLRRGYACG